MTNKKKFMDEKNCIVSSNGVLAITKIQKLDLDGFRRELKESDFEVVDCGDRAGSHWCVFPEEKNLEGHVLYNLKYVGRAKKILSLLIFGRVTGGKTNDLFSFHYKREMPLVVTERKFGKSTSDAAVVIAPRWKD